MFKYAETDSNLLMQLAKLQNLKLIFEIKTHIAPKT